MILGGSSHLLSRLDPRILDIQHSYGRWPMKIENLYHDLTVNQKWLNMATLTYPIRYILRYISAISQLNPLITGAIIPLIGMNEVGTQLVFGYPVSKTRLMRCQPLETWI